MPADTVKVFRPSRFGNQWPARETTAQQGITEAEA
jgi:hypothetical protein